MSTALWIVQALLAVAFLVTGSVKAFRYDLARKNMAFTRVMPKAFVMFIGVVEILGGIGVVVPSATGILPMLSVLAAIGLVIVMIGAVGTHIRLKELDKVPGPIVLIALCVFVAYGRQFLAPI